MGVGEGGEKEVDVDDLGGSAAREEDLGESEGHSV